MIKIVKRTFLCCGAILLIIAIFGGVKGAALTAAILGGVAGLTIGIFFPTKQSKLS
jgi:hypothetical protein